MTSGEAGSAGCPIHDDGLIVVMGGVWIPPPSSEHFSPHLCLFGHKSTPKSYFMNTLRNIAGEGGYLSAGCPVHDDMAHRRHERGSRFTPFYFTGTTGRLI